jgi:hypothetical protein
MRYRRNDGLDATVIDSDLFLVEPASEEVFYLDSLGHGLWRLLAEPQELEDILVVFRAAFPDTPVQRLRTDLLAALDNLMARGLVAAVA